MDAFVWDQRFVTGLDSVDSQHRHLVDQVNRLGDLRLHGAAGEAEMEALFADLANYAAYHFREEERLMQEWAVDPRHADTHVRHHQEFVEQVTLMWQNRDVATDAQAMLFDFLAAWLTVHILGEDQAMGRNIARIRQGSPAAAAFEADRAAQDNSLSALLDALHNLYGVLAVQNRDLAEARAGLEVKVEARTRDLAEANAQLLRSEKMASLGRMVAGFAHEINTPIGIALGAISHEEETLAAIDSMLTSPEVEEEDLRTALDTIRQGDRLALANLQRCADLVQRFKRSSIDQASEQPRVFDMAELIEDVRFSLHTQFKHLPVTIRVECPAGLVVDGVPGRIGQILTNLMMNSVQHGFDGGTRPGTIRIHVSRPDPDRLHIVYADDGAGMAPTMADRLFEPFATTARARGGTGLGLFLCYNIVTNELGGTITCDSRPGTGARFDISFPIKAVTP